MSYHVTLGAAAPDPFKLFETKLAELRQGKAEEDAGLRPPAPKSTLNWWCWDTPGFKDCFPMAFRAAQMDCAAQGKADQGACINPLADHYAQGCPCPKEAPPDASIWPSVAASMSKNTWLVVGVAALGAWAMFGGKKKQTPNRRRNGKDKRATATYVRMGQIERGSDYHWTEGYSRDGREYPWLTKREAQAQAKSEGKRAVFVEKKS